MTTTRVFQTCPVPGPPDVLAGAFRRDPGWWLPPPAQPAGDNRWRLRLDAGRFSRPALVTVGSPWELGEMTWRILSWEPLTEDSEVLPVERILPAFHGEVGLRVVGAPTLVVEGSYKPPLGRMGATLDHTFLHKLADRTVRELVVALAKRLQTPDLIAS